MDITEQRSRDSGPQDHLEGSYIDWPAILGGSVVAVAIILVLTAFGAVLGLSTISAIPGETQGTLAVILSAVWIVVTPVASYIAGGYITGRMRRRVDTAAPEEVSARDGINGLVVWGLGIVTSLFVLGVTASSSITAAGNVATVAGSVAETAISTTGAIAGELANDALLAAGPMIPENVNPMEFVTDTMLRPAQVSLGGNNNEGLARETTAILGNIINTGEISASDRTYLIGAVVARTGLPEPEAATRVDDAVATAQQTRADAIALAESVKAEADRIAAEAMDATIKTAEAARVAAILTAFILAASALVAAVGAYVGAVRGGRHRDEGRILGRVAFTG